MFSNPVKTAKLLQKAARDSYRLDKVLYETSNISIASAFNVIIALETKIKTIDYYSRLLCYSTIN
jgi:hypothetical protein